jgi:adenylylsulfate kinase-like enzyme
MIFWFTGLSGSGKTTFSKYLIKKLNKKIKKKIIHIDGDSFRLIFNDLGYSAKDRIKNSERVCKLVNFLNKSGKFLIIVSMVSISSKWLEWIQKRNLNYYQFFIDVPIEILKKRNTRNIYNKKNIVGVHIKYKKPKKNFLVFRNSFKKSFLKNSILKILNNKKIKKALKNL